MKKILSVLLIMMLLALIACTAEPVSQDETTQPTATAVPAEAAVAPPETAVLESEPEPEPETNLELDTFIEQLQTAVTNQDYAAMQALMSDPIGAGPWRSQWQILTPVQMVEQFRNNSLPAPLSVQFSGLSLAEITDLLGGQLPEEMLGSDVNVVAVLHSGGWGQSTGDDALLFVTEEDGRYTWSAFLYTNGRFADASVGMTAAPAGLIYIVWDEGIYQVQADGSHQQLLDAQTASIPNLKVSPDGRYAAYLNDERHLWLIENSSGDQQKLAGDFNLSNYHMWGSPATLFTGVWLTPDEGEGPNNGHIATINVDTDQAVQILDEEHLSSNRPVLAADDQTVAFDIFPAGPGDTNTSRLYHPDSGLTVFDPASFTPTNEMIDQARFNPAWSPDGRQIAWLSSTGERVGLQVFNLEAQTAGQIYDWDPARFGALIPSPVWSPDGKWLMLEIWANGLEGSGVWLIAADGSSHTLVDAQGQEPYWVNEQQIVFGVNGGPRLYNLASGEMFKLDLPEGSWVIGVTPSAG